MKTCRVCVWLHDVTRLRPIFGALAVFTALFLHAPLSMIALHTTVRYFIAAVVLGLASIVVAWVTGPTGLIAIVAAMAFIGWALRRSETRGFVRSGQMRRAFEPERHFTGVQTAALFAILMLQTLVGAFVLVR